MTDCISFPPNSFFGVFVISRVFFETIEQQGIMDTSDDHPVSLREAIRRDIATFMLVF